MSGAPKEEKKEESPDAGKPGGGRKMGPMVVAVLVILALQAGLAFGVMRFLGVSDRGAAKASHPKASPEGDASAEESEEDDSPKKHQKLECLEKPLSKTVTIAGTEAKRYLKAAMCIEYDAEKYKDLPKTIEPSMMRIEATANRILSSATFQQVNDPHGQDTLAAQIATEANKLLKGEKIQIHAVLVTEWLVQ
jgi:flagellar basal body-associated protein FliL